MGTEAISSALRLELRPGEWVLWDARPHRFESLVQGRARIRDATNDELRDVSISEIRSLSYLPAAEMDARIDQQRTVEPAEWSLAEKRESAIREVLTGDGPTKERVQAAAVALGMSARAVYRLVARYRISAQTTSLLRRRRGPNKTRRRLGDTRERVIDEAIERRYLVRPRTPMEEVYRNVKKRCRELSIPAPARGSVLARIRALDARHIVGHRRRHTVRAGRARRSRGSLCPRRGTLYRACLSTQGPGCSLDDVRCALAHVWITETHVGRQRSRLSRRCPAARL